MVGPQQPKKKKNEPINTTTKAWHSDQLLRDTPISVLIKSLCSKSQQVWSRWKQLWKH